MRVVTCPRTGEWIVVAEWHGAEREVQRGELLDLLRWVADQKEA